MSIDVDDPFALPSDSRVSHRGDLIQRGRYRLPNRDGSPRGNVTELSGPYGAKGWMRTTNLVSAHSDQFALRMWEIEQVFRSVVLPRADVLLADLANSVPTWDDITKERRKQVVEGFLERSKALTGADRGARHGTHRHGIVEEWHEDEQVGRHWTAAGRRDVSLYASALIRNQLKALPGMQERQVLIEELEAVGTLDNVLTDMVTDALYIGDLKGLALTTPLATPNGWTTMGAVQVGDQVFDAYGKPCTVTAKSRIKQIGTYIVRFDDGSEIVCDPEHIWWTATGQIPGPPRARPIAEVIDTFRNPQGQAHHRVPVAGALDLPDVDLPIEPYLLGCWLGNGDKGSGTITSMPDLFESLEAEGHVFGKEAVDPRGNRAVRRTALGLQSLLRRHGLFGNKHIPDAYLRASAGQRLRLLQGLMDTDGTWNTARKTAVFYSVNKALALQVVELLATLGQRPYHAEVPTTGYGKNVISHHVSFTPVDIVPFRLPRKAEQAIASAKPTTRSRRRVIVSIEPGPDVPTACIAVDSETHTYLCGDRMIPTHNTQPKFWTYMEVKAQFACYANACAMWEWAEDGSGRWVDMPPVSREVAFALWMPRKPEDPERAVGWVPRVEVLEMDIVAGWRTARRAYEIVQDRATGRTGARLRKAPPVTLTEQYAARFAAVETTVEGSALVAEAREAGVWDEILAGCARAAHARLAR